MNTISTVLRRLSIRHVAVAAAVTAVVVLAAVGGLNRHHNAAGTVPPVTMPSSDGWTASTPSPTDPAAASQSAPADTGDDGAPDPITSPSPTTGDGLQVAQEATVEFLARFLNTAGQSATQWHKSWQDLVTPQLAQLLADVDMTRVPVGRVGQVKSVAAFGTGQAVVTTPIVANTDVNKTVVTVKVTTVYAGDGRWLVSQIDQVQP